MKWFWRSIHNVSSFHKLDDDGITKCKVLDHFWIFWNGSWTYGFWKGLYGSWRFPDLLAISRQQFGMKFIHSFYRLLIYTYYRNTQQITEQQKHRKEGQERKHGHTLWHQNMYAPKTNHAEREREQIRTPETVWKAIKCVYIHHCCADNKIHGYEHERFHAPPDLHRKRVPSA